VPTLTPERLQALAAAVRSIRAAKRLTQEDVANRARLDRKTVSRIESGSYLLTFAALVSVADGLGVPLSELVRVYEERLGAGG